MHGIQNKETQLSLKNVRGIKVCGTHMCLAHLFYWLLYQRLL